MSKKVVLSGYYGFKNFGDEAILSLLVNKLKAVNCDITVISANPEYTKTLYNDIRTVKTFDITSIIKAILKSDILISGGGSLLQDVTSLKSLIYYLFVIFIALILKKRVVIFAQGIGPINNKLGQLLTKNLLKHCYYISVRDDNSAELLSNWGIKSEVVPDPVFSVPIEKIDKNKILGIQLRDCKAMNDLFLNNLADFVISHFKGYNIEIYSLQDSIDLPVCNKFESLIKDKFNVKVYSEMSYKQVINSINSCEYLISMRFHSIITGLLLGVKTASINYDIKVKKLADEFNLPVFELNKAPENQYNELCEEDIDAVLDKLNDKKFNWDKFYSEIFA